MGYIDIKLPKEENGLFPKPSKIFDWDVMVDGREYVVGEFQGYIHSYSYRFGKTTTNNLYCWPRGEEPNESNLLEYDMPYDGPVDWGIVYKPYNYSNYKYDPETRHIGYITITRNGKEFYEFGGNMHTGIDHARCIIDNLDNIPINFYIYDYVNKEIIGRECYFYGYKAKVDYWCEGQGCVILVCDEEDPERRKEALAKWDAEGCEDGQPKIDIIDPYPGTGFRWFKD